MSRLCGIIRPGRLRVWSCWGGGQTLTVNSRGGQTLTVNSLRTFGDGRAANRCRSPLHLFARSPLPTLARFCLHPGPCRAQCPRGYRKQRRRTGRGMGTPTVHGHRAHSRSAAVPAGTAPPEDLGPAHPVKSGYLVDNLQGIHQVKSCSRARRFSGSSSFARFVRTGFIGVAAPSCAPASRQRRIPAGAFKIARPTHRPNC